MDDLWHTTTLFFPTNQEILSKLVSYFSRNKEHFERIVGIETSGIPLATLLAKELNCPLSIASVGIPRVRPRPSRSESILVFDDVYITGYNFTIVKKVLDAGYKPKEIKFAILASLPINADPVKTHERINLGRLKEFPVRTDVLVEYEDFPTPEPPRFEGRIQVPQQTSSPQSSRMRDLSTEVEKLCIDKNPDGEPMFIRTWQLLENISLLEELSEQFAQACAQVEGEAVFAASLFAIPLATLISTRLRLPLIYLREHRGRLEINPRVEMFSDLRRPFVIDTLLRHGDKLRELFQQGFLTPWMSVFFKPVVNAIVKEDYETLVRDLKGMGNVSIQDPILKIPS